VKILVLETHEIFMQFFRFCLEDLGVGDNVSNTIPVLNTYNDYDLIFANPKFFPIVSPAYLVCLSALPDMPIGAHRHLMKPFTFEQVKEILDDCRKYHPPHL